MREPRYLDINQLVMAPSPHQDMAFLQTINVDINNLYMMIGYTIVVCSIVYTWKYIVGLKSSTTMDSIGNPLLPITMDEWNINIRDPSEIGNHRFANNIYTLKPTSDLNGTLSDDLAREVLEHLEYFTNKYKEVYNPIDRNWEAFLVDTLPEYITPNLPSYNDIVEALDLKNLLVEQWSSMTEFLDDQLMTNTLKGWVPECLPSIEGFSTSNIHMELYDSITVERIVEVLNLF